MCSGQLESVTSGRREKTVHIQKVPHLEKEERQNYETVEKSAMINSFLRNFKEKGSKIRSIILTSERFKRYI